MKFNREYFDHKDFNDSVYNFNDEAISEILGIANQKLEPVFDEIEALRKENDELKKENEKLASVLTDAWFVLQGSVARLGQSEEALEKRSSALERFWLAFEKAKQLLGEK